LTLQKSLLHKDGRLHKNGSWDAENPWVKRKLGFVLIPLGLVSFLASSMVWLFTRPPLPTWWAVTTAGGLLCVGWGTVLVLPKIAARWGAIYMTVMSVVVPLVTVSQSHH
jgi:hypothetical protein